MEFKKLKGWKRRGKRKGLRGNEGGGRVRVGGRRDGWKKGPRKVCKRKGKRVEKG